MPAVSTRNGRETSRYIGLGQPVALQLEKRSSFGKKWRGQVDARNAVGIFTCKEVMGKQCP